MLIALRSLWEPSITPTPTLPNRQGRVYKSQYPYFKPREKPYWETGDPDEEEFLAIIGIDLD
jgi:hypothetical protein